MRNITDTYNRQFRSLRVSLLDRCNFSCLYCVDGTEKKMEKSNGRSLPDAEEMKSMILQLHRILQLHVIRLTGGEPLLFRELASLVRSLKELGGPAIRITTNGYLLQRMADELAAAGLNEVNVSIDAVDPQLFELITGSRHLQKVIDGIDAALAAGMQVKLNAVIMRGYNEEQILPLLQFAAERKLIIRFLELMKMGYLHSKGGESIFTAHDILHSISGTGPLLPLPRRPGATARYWKTASGQTFGIIANETIPFCSDCDRLRLSSQGKLYGCLSDPQGFSIRGLEDEQVMDILEKAIRQKQPLRFAGSSISMQAIGG
jgi:cyclic pyranopterin phosphate synthase